MLQSPVKKMNERLKWQIGEFKSVVGILRLMREEKTESVALIDKLDLGNKGWSFSYNPEKNNEDKCIGSRGKSDVITIDKNGDIIIDSPSLCAKMANNVFMV